MQVVRYAVRQSKGRHGGLLSLGSSQKSGEWGTTGTQTVRGKWPNEGIWLEFYEMETKYGTVKTLCVKLQVRAEE